MILQPLRAAAYAVKRTLQGRKRSMSGFVYIYEVRGEAASPPLNPKLVEPPDSVSVGSARWSPAGITIFIKPAWNWRVSFFEPLLQC